MRSIAENQRPAPGELYLDHVAHFVPDLGAAARVAESLGFKVTPESAHRAQGAPAGTSNRCIMLEEGYIEILAPTLDTPHAQRVRERMARYDGVHLACFGTPDAETEHQRLAGHGFEPEPLVSLERTLEGGEKVRFKVVYVPPAKMPEGRSPVRRAAHARGDLDPGEPRARQRRDRAESDLRRRRRSGANRGALGALFGPAADARRRTGAPGLHAAAGCSSAPGMSSSASWARRPPRQASPATDSGAVIRKASPRVAAGWGSRCTGAPPGTPSPCPPPLAASG